MVKQEATPLVLLLKEAQSWQEAGKTRQAMAAYFKLLEYFPDTEEVHSAQEQLRDLAQRFEAEEKLYTASRIYTRLHNCLG
jgi:hypothetical protein